MEEATKLEKQITIQSIDVEGILWRDKTMGNTYHIVRAIINDKYSVTVDEMTYGYGSSYVDTIAKELEKRGIIALETNQNGSKEVLWRYCKRNNITKTENDKVASLKKDLKFEEYEMEKFEELNPPTQPSKPKVNKPKIKTSSL